MRDVMFNPKISTIILVLVCCTINNFGLTNGARPKVRRQSDLNENTVPSSSINQISYKTAEARETANLLNQCVRGTPEFNECLKKAVTFVTKYIQTGIPELKIPIMDPIEVKEIPLRRTSPIAFRTKLKNVVENGWKTVRIVNIKEVNSRELKVRLQFGNKDTIADYELEIPALNFNNLKGKLKLFMYGLNATATFTRLKDDSIKVFVDIERLGGMKVYITFPGNPALENFVNTLFNSSMWRTVFAVLKPILDELVSNGYTQFANRENTIDNILFRTLLPLNNNS